MTEHDWVLDDATGIGSTGMHCRVCYERRSPDPVAENTVPPWGLAFGLAAFIVAVVVWYLA